MIHFLFNWNLNLNNLEYLLLDLDNLRSFFYLLNLDNFLNLDSLNFDYFNYFLNYFLNFNKLLNFYYFFDLFNYNYLFLYFNYLLNFNGFLNFYNFINNLFYNLFNLYNPFDWHFFNYFLSRNLNYSLHYLLNLNWHLYNSFP